MELFLEVFSILALNAPIHTRAQLTLSLVMILLVWLDKTRIEPYLYLLEIMLIWLLVILLKLDNMHFMMLLWFKITEMMNLHLFKW
jgi:hypothetical protein